MKKLIVSRLAVLSATLLASVNAFAAAVDAGEAVGVDAFNSFRDTVINWAQGPLGTGLSITMMLMGAGAGVARNSPMPALSGIAGAAFLNWGPAIIQNLTEGALI